MSATYGELPFQPIRSTLYSAAELTNGFDAASPASAGSTMDFLTYKYFIVNGGAAPTDPYAGMMEALHDNSIVRAQSRLVNQLKQAQRPIVAIMGGHDELRNSPRFADVVEISRRLTKAGCLVASGGGPGAMEAAHLGALLAEKSDTEILDAIKKLADVPKLPDNTTVVDPDNGTVNTTILAQLHHWLKPAYELAQRYTPGGGQSLAVPTWYYGNEPTSPLATHVAKYFQNSIREDVLLAAAANGIIYAEGKAGTLQEVFQDAAQNYYRDASKGEAFAPMIFFGEDFWTKTLPVMPLLEALFLGRKGMPENEFRKHVAIVATVDEAVDRLLDTGPSIDKTISRMKSLGLGKMMSAVQ